LQIVATTFCGFGVVAVLQIPPGQLVCEYLGQIISETEAQRLQRQVYIPLGLNYIWTDCNLFRFFQLYILHFWQF
jgi:hypothetical protein